MITIRYESGDPRGDCTYEILFKDEMICKFEHHRPDGLYKCLQKAADAVELSEWADRVLMDDAKGG